MLSARRRRRHATNWITAEPINICFFGPAVTVTYLLTILTYWA